ncbi:hypothetical protein M9Y10_042381 [Tritrichomonas musculus]|uniref:Uncharacterized protein n=1 Tax=Tritrichomonas musculus TaxID=1915356 RepID=A0ABR2GPR9_9EUKA
MASSGKILMNERTGALAFDAEEILELQDAPSLVAVDQRRTSVDLATHQGAEAKKLSKSHLFSI